MDSFVCKQKTAYEMGISGWGSGVCPSDRRIEHHRLEPPEFVGGQRAAIQIAMLDEYRPLRARGRRLEAKAGVTRGLRGVDLARDRQRKRAKAGEQIGRHRGGPDRLAYRCDQRRDRKSTRLNSSH